METIKISNIKIEENKIIRCKNHLISIGITNTDVAIISKNTFEFCQFKDIKKGGLLQKVKNKFRNKLCSTTEFCFTFMYEDDIKTLIKMLN